MNNMMQNMMKPVNPATIHLNSEDTKRQQEAVVMAILQDSPYSMTARDIGNAIDLPSFPGYDRGTFPSWMCAERRATRMASRICRRLETQGQIISTLYQGARLYSIPVNGETA